MMKKLIVIAMVTMLLVSILAIATAATLSDPVFDSATTFLTTTKKANFYAETSSVQGSIKVTRVRLYKMVGDTWSYVGDLPVPTKESTNTIVFSTSYDYSSYIGSGTYRVYTTFNADGYAISRYSNTRTY